MSTEILNVLLGFLEGFALIISPCIWPILPIILAGSLTGSKKRPLGIISGFIFSFALIAYFSRQIVHYFGIDINWLRAVSYGILFLLGLIMLSDYLTEKFNHLTLRLAGVGYQLSAVRSNQNGFFGGVIFGSLVAVIWTPCAGPILAAVLVQAVIQETTRYSFFTLLAFALGAALPMLIITIYGIKLVTAFDFLKTKTQLMRKLLGFIIIVSVGFMIYQERYAAPSAVAESSIKTAVYLQKGLWKPYPAPRINTNEAWINSPPLQQKDLQGKVVLVDFWTYSCINCIRTLPYLKNWYKQYQKKGLIIIGVHSPEFAFEKKLDNVKQAVKQQGIPYPVVLDNQFITWRNFRNLYWPANYLIDKEGKVVYQHFGEGDYEVIENNIRYLLGLNTVVIPTVYKQEKHTYDQSPETYLGYARANIALGPSLIPDKTASYHFSQSLSLNSWRLEGAWLAKADKIIAKQANAAITIHFKARKVFMVMGAADKKMIEVKLLLNGKSFSSNKKKSTGKHFIIVKRNTLYQVLGLKKVEEGILQVIATEPGLEIYTFTFGN